MLYLEPGPAQSMFDFGLNLWPRAHEFSAQDQERNRMYCSDCKSSTRDLLKYKSAGGNCALWFNCVPFSLWHSLLLDYCFSVYCPLVSSSVNISPPPLQTRPLLFHHTRYTIMGRKLSQNRTKLFHSVYFSMSHPTSVSARVQYTINIDSCSLIICFCCFVSA
jgi:hypothetical protein